LADDDKKGGRLLAAALGAHAVCLHEIVVIISLCLSRKKYNWFVAPVGPARGLVSSETTTGKKSSIFTTTTAAATSHSHHDLKDLWMTGSTRWFHFSSIQRGGGGGGGNLYEDFIKIGSVAWNLPS
jgi:hypothetical protein